MKLYRSHILFCSLLGCALAAAAGAQGRWRRPGGPPPDQTGVSTTVSGSISQLNYDRDAEVEGFLLSNKTLVHLPRRSASRIADSLHPGDSVQISGYARTSAAGMQTIEAQAVQDRTSGKTFTGPQPGAPAPYSGSGRIQQLNYGPDGAVNGLLFDNGTLVTVAAFSATNPSSVRVGATVGYTGFARTSFNGRTVVDVQSLTINGQMLSMTMGRPAGPTPPRTQPPAPALNAAPTAPPAGRTDQPTPPPSPSQPPGSY